MNVLIVGQGGREHALAWKAAQSPLAGDIFVAPGNAGTGSEPGIFNVGISVNDIDKLAKYAIAKNVGLTIVGPEMPLANGIADSFAEKGLNCFGTNVQASQLESSKHFGKRFMERHGIPTAEYRSFADPNDAQKFIDSGSFPMVIKADGLAAGKGVTIVNNCEESRFALHQILVEKRFGAAGERIVIEQFIEGEEASFMCMVDGKNIVELPSSQDHKAAYDADQGPNTGGMGAYSPASVINDAMREQILQTVIQPTVAGMREEGVEYKGFLYAGLIIRKDGTIQVLEFNCRLGDPETQPVMMRLQSDIVELCLAGCNGEFEGVSANWDQRASLGVVAVAGGYPGEYASGAKIKGLDQQLGPDQKIFHAGTGKDAEGEYIVGGGRVLCATAIAEEIAAAQSGAYDIMQKIKFKDMHYRTDIGYRALSH